MAKLPTKLFLSIVGGASLLAGTVARGVIVDGPNGTGTTNTSPSSYPVAGMNNVGTFAGASGVYLGNGWVICASHEAPLGNFAAGGETFVFPDGTTDNSDGLYYRLTTPGNGSADLVMAHLLPSTAVMAHSALLINSSTPPATRTAIYDIGNGLTRGSDTTYETLPGYTETSPNVLRWGQNVTVDTAVIGYGGSTFTDDEGYGTTTMFAASFAASTTQISSGDSGGGVFSTGNVLLGINLYDFAYNGQPADTAVHGNASSFADLSTYYTQIETILPTPEPSTVAMLICGCGGLLMRRRIASRSFH